MAVVETLTERIFEPGPFDPHTHPRIFDAVTLGEKFDPLNQGREGKAGLTVYTDAAARAGFTAMLAMSNEMVRLYDPKFADGFEMVSFPISNRDRLLAAMSSTQHEALIPTGHIVGFDSEAIFADAECTQLDEDAIVKNLIAMDGDYFATKIFGAESTGGNMVETKFIPRMLQLAYSVNENAVNILHLEDEGVAGVLRNLAELPGGENIPVHIAHVSSKEELQAVIEAKRSGMNVTCEVTPHHLFLDSSLRVTLGSYASMKPTLKEVEDIEFLWENIDFIDMFASDCAPHRKSDKEDTQKITYGVVNHTVMLPLLLGAVEQGRITIEKVYEMLCINPRKRFNLPINDGSKLIVSRNELSPAELEQHIHPKYGENPFLKIDSRDLVLIGKVVELVAGKSHIHADGTVSLRSSYTHLLRPRVVQL